MEALGEGGRTTSSKQVVMGEMEIEKKMAAGGVLVGLKWMSHGKQIRNRSNETNMQNIAGGVRSQVRRAIDNQQAVSPADHRGSAS